ncbi:hypothetical protein WOLCODRAFT_135818 [Wolfiporia cocos MD-104 SS10]|uniref:Uncharacterized protein n=1 Tax=Wolfiporia cocos (strain MD-104) TaxID=742152 RepID=A0A2H3JJ17_WOLCO|nr:hypothetical protein WOLCODRAFT_135818 [Wolfiporia cocos MD-104 SS10]
MRRAERNVSQSERYYQLGGFMPHIYDLRSLSDIPDLNPDSPEVDLILGILPNGASYILIPESRYVRSRWRRFPPKEPLRPERFISLSPIHFSSKEALDKKLSTMVSKKKNKNGERRDRSKANTSYTVAGDALTKAGEARAYFEHQRIVAHILRGMWDMVKECSISPASWPSEVRILAFTCTLWTADTRGLQERERDPRILDVGWTEFQMAGVKAQSTDLRPMATTHCVHFENRILSNPGLKRTDCSYGGTQVLPEKAIGDRLRSQLSSLRESSNPSRVLLLTYDQRMSEKVLQALGIDTSRFTFGLSDMLCPRNFNPANRAHVSGLRDSSLRQSRSRSPRGRTEGIESRQRSPPASQCDTHDVVVVDVCAQYSALKPGSIPGGLRDSAKSLRVHDLPPPKSENARSSTQIRIDENGMCAGNDSRLLGLMWYSMATGAAIDEQREERWSSVPPAEYGGTSKLDETKFTPQAEDDEDVDPNDMILPTAQSTRPSSAAKPGPSADPDRWSDISSDEDY